MNLELRQLNNGRFGEAGIRKSNDVELVRRDRWSCQTKLVGEVVRSDAEIAVAVRERRAQLDLLARFIRDTSCEGPRVVMGDFNEWHRGPVTRGLKLEFSSPMRRMRRTHPAMFPLFRLDRIYWDVELQGEEFLVHRTRLARVASDHLPVVARLRVRRRTAAAPPYVTGDALPPAE